MYMSRDIMHCKPGKVKDMVTKFKKMSDLMKKRGFPPMRIFTDVAGERYWTVVAEQEVEKIDDFAEMARQTMADQEFMEVFKGYHELVESGRRELYKVE
jgi:hypothetical protein